MSRLVATILVAALLAGNAVAGTAFAQVPTGQAPSTHAGTRLSFPPTLGGATLERSTAFGSEAVNYEYSIQKMQISVFIYDGGRHVPSGSENSAVMTQFTGEVNSAEQQLKAGGFANFERPPVPSTCTYGSVSFRCIIYSANAQGGRLFSKLLMTGYNGYFLKIRIDWSQANGQTSVDADHVLQAFVPALIH